MIVDLNHRILELEREYGEEVLSDAILEYASRQESRVRVAIAEFAKKCAKHDADLLDVAASIASHHHSFADEESAIRSLLTLLAVQSQLALEIGGKPRKVVDDFGQLTVSQARLRGEGIWAIWAHPMLESRDVAIGLGVKPSNREKVRQYRERSWIVGLQSGRGYLYPAFQLDSNRCEVFPEVRAANLALSANSDPWGTASWWISGNARLGASPIDLVGTDRAQDVIDAAGAVTEQVG